MYLHQSYHISSQKICWQQPVRLIIFDFWLLWNSIHQMTRRSLLNDIIICNLSDYWPRNLLLEQISMCLLNRIVLTKSQFQNITLLHVMLQRRQWINKITLTISVIYTTLVLLWLNIVLNHKNEWNKIKTKIRSIIN